MLIHFPKSIRTRWFEKSTDVCPVVRNGSKSPQWCGARWRKQDTVHKCFVNGTEVVSAATSPRSTIEVTGNQVNFLRNHDGTESEDELLGNAFLFCIDVANMKKQHRKVSARLLADAEIWHVREHLVDPSLFSFTDLSRQVSPGIMKVDGLDINVGVKGVLVEENRTTCVMGHVEAIREKLVVNILGRLLQGNDMPLCCNVLFEGIFFLPAGSRVPAVDAESPLRNRTSRKTFLELFHVRRGSVFSFICLAKLCCSLLNVHHMLDQDFVFAQFGP